MSNQRNTKTLPLSANSSIQCKKKIANISDKEVTSILIEIKRFLISRSFLDYWTEESVYQKIIEKII